MTRVAHVYGRTTEVHMCGGVGGCVLGDHHERPTEDGNPGSSEILTHAA